MNKLLDILKNVGFPYAYDHFAEGEAPDPPFICYLLPGSDNFSADGKVYYRKTLWTPAVFFMRNRRPGSTARSCMKSCMCLKCRQVRKAAGQDK